MNVVGAHRSRNAGRVSVGRFSRTLTSSAAALVVVAGTITAFGAGVALVDAPPAAAALSCTDNWNGNGGTTDWNTGTNWSTGVPNSSSDACIPGSASVVVPNAAFSVNELTVSSGATLTIGASGGTTVASLSVGNGFENDGTTTAGPSATGFASLTLNGPSTNTGTLTVDGTTTIGNVVTALVTNQGTWTVGSAASVTVGGSSTFVQSGSSAQLTDLDTTVNSFVDNGGLAVDGGTICATAPELHGGAPSNNGGVTLAFGSSTPAGPACTTGQAVDQIDAGSGTNLLTGNIAAGYGLTTLNNATLEPTTTLANNGSITLDPGQILDNTSGVSVTNAGSIDVPTAGTGSTFNVNTFTNAATGSVSVEAASFTIGNTVTSLVTNQGTWTLGSAANVTVGGSSTFVQSGSGAQLTDLDTTVNSFVDNGGLAVDGGTICATAPDLHGGAPSNNSGVTLAFGSSTPAGPACTTGQAVDQIDAGSGTNLLTGNIAAGYGVTTLNNATLEPTTTLTNNGSITLNPGQILLNSSSLSLTNAGSIDVPATGTGSTFNVTTFTTSGTFSVEANSFTIGNTVTSLVTNQGTWTVGSAANVTIGGTSSFVQSGAGAQLNDLDTTVNSIDDNGGLAIDGGTICGTAPDLHGGAPTNNGGNALVFGSSTPAGPACSTGQAFDQIDAGSGTNLLTGNIAAGYGVTTLNNATLEPTSNVINNGSITLNPGQILLNSSTLTLTNAGSIDVPSSGTGSTFNVTTFTNAPTGSFSIEAASFTIGNTVTTLVTNRGTWTLGSAANLVVGGSSTFVQNGVVTDNDVTGNSATVDNNSFDDNGSFVVDGGTICGTAPDLHGGAPAGATLIFGSSPQAGPDCAAALSQDQIVLGSGTNTLTGDIPTGYGLTTLNNSTLEPTVSLTNNGTIVLDPGQILENTGGVTFTNAGSIDIPSSGSTYNVNNTTNASTGALTIEGTLTIGNTVTSAWRNDGTIGVAPGAQVTVGSSSSITNESDGLLAFGMSGPNTSTTNYGRITGGTLTLGGSADPVFDNGFTPTSGEEYFVYSGGTVSGTFASVLHNATADYSHAGEVGLVGGAPATATSTSVASSTNGTSVYGQGVQFTATVTPSSGSNPTGTVSFFSNGSLLGSAPVITSAGVTTASIDLSTLRVGTDIITATYNGDVVFDASTSALQTQSVGLDPSHVTVSPSPTSPVPGQPETYTVQVTSTAPGAGTPTGDVSLTDNGTAIPGCQNLVMGPLGPSSVTCSLTYTATGPHAIVASYAGDTDFTSGTGNQSLTVQPAATSTAVASSANPGPIGVPITYTATVSVVAPGSGTPTGTVSFLDNGSQPAAGCQNLALPATPPLQVTCTETYGSGAGHAIVATYSGDANDATSNGSLSETLSQISTTTSVSAPTTSNYGQPVTLSATVLPSQSASVNPSGSVTFYDDTDLPPQVIATVPVITAGGVTRANFTTSSLIAATHDISATYGGDSTYESSSSTSDAGLTVSADQTSISLSSSANPSVFGQTVTFTATISSSATGETGTVQFAVDGSPVGTGSPVIGGQASYQTSSLSLGSHSVTAMYEGDDNFVGSSTLSPLSQVVDQDGTNTAIVSNDNPGSVGETITYTATVSAASPGSGTPTGTISFSDGGNPIATCQGLSLSSGQAQCSQVYSDNASHSITTSYGGDANFTGSSGGPFVETMTSVGTTTSIGPSSQSATYGEGVTFTATVAPDTGSADPTGTVTFVDNGTTVLGTSSLSTTAGVTTASILVTSLPLGTDSISASYGGVPGFLASATTTSATVDVSQASTSVSVVSSTGSPSTYGQSVTFSATVMPTTGSGETGTVTFFDNGSILGTGSVANNVATFTTSSLSVASHPITASYGGDANFEASPLSTTVTQVVDKAPTTVSLQSSRNPSTSGQTVTFTATVTPQTGSGETGTVTFFDNGSPIGTGSVSGGQATFGLTTLSVASHPITASYGGDGNFSASPTSNTVNQVVQSGVGTTSTAVTSSANPSTVSQTVTLTATVTPTSVGSSPFTGTVTFDEGSTALGTVPVSSAGLASIALPQLATAYAIGTHSITAIYSGDTNWTGSTSSPMNQVVASPVYFEEGFGRYFDIANSVTGAVVLKVANPGWTCNCTTSNSLAVSPDATRAYELSTTFLGNSTLTIFNTATGGAVALVPLPGSDVDLSMSHDGGTLYVLSYNPHVTVSAVNTTSGAVTASVTLAPQDGAFPPAMAINPSGTELAVSDIGATAAATVDIVSLPALTVAAQVPLPGAWGVAFSPTGSLLYVTDGHRLAPTGTNTVSAISTATNTVVRTYSGFTAPVGLAVTPDGTQFFVADESAALPLVSAVNAATGTAVTMTEPGVPTHLAVSPDGSTAYVSDELTCCPGQVNEIATFNTATHASGGTLAAPNGPGTVIPYGHPAPPPPPQPITIGTSLPQAIQNVTYWRALSVTGGVGSYSFALTSGTLPAGLSLLPTGVIAGTAASNAVTSTFTVKVTDSNYPPDTGSASITLSVQAATTAPPPCGGSAAASGFFPPPPPPLNCTSGTNTRPGGTATATSTGTAGRVSVSATGTGSLTVGQYAAPPSGGVTFRAGNFFDLALSSLNSFTSVTVVDCALGGATSLMWLNPVTVGGTSAYLPVTPETYNPATHCVTVTFSATSSPPISALNGTIFGGVLPSETVSIRTGGSSPYSVTGSVISGAITISGTKASSTVQGTVTLNGSSGQPVTVTVDTTCDRGACTGTFSVADSGTGVSFTTPTTLTQGPVTRNRAGGKGLVPASGTTSAYPLKWEVTLSPS
jgi:hypothetical protein